MVAFVFSFPANCVEVFVCYDTGTPAAGCELGHFLPFVRLRIVPYKNNQAYMNNLARSLKLCSVLELGRDHSSEGLVRIIGRTSFKLVSPAAVFRVIA